MRGFMPPRIAIFDVIFIPAYANCITIIKTKGIILALPMISLKVFCFTHSLDFLNFVLESVKQNEVGRLRKCVLVHMKGGREMYI